MSKNSYTPIYILLANMRSNEPQQLTEVLSFVGIGYYRRTLNKIAKKLTQSRRPGPLCPRAVTPPDPPLGVPAFTTNCPVPSKALTFSRTCGKFLAQYSAAFSQLPHLVITGCGELMIAENFASIFIFYH